MGKEKVNILLRVEPEVKEAIKIAAESEHRNMTNFIEAMILNNPKVKEELELKTKKIKVG